MSIRGSGFSTVCGAGDVAVQHASGRRPRYVEAAATALKEIRTNPELVAERTAKGKMFMNEHFSIANFKKSVDVFLDGHHE